MIELVIVVTIIPVIIAAISAGLITVLSLQSSLSNRLADTSDAQTVSATFVKDVQSATYFNTSTTPSDPGQCGGGYQLLGMQWNGGQTVVSYVSVPVTVGSKTTYSLVRQYCASGILTSSTIVSNDIASPPDPNNPDCSNSQCPPDLTGSSPDGTQQPWKSASQVPSVNFVINELLSPFTYTLTASSRAWTNPAAASVAVGPAFAPLTVLSPGCASCNVLSIGTYSSMTVNASVGANSGTVAITSPFANSVSISSGGALTATGVLTANPSLNSLSGSVPAESYASQIVDPPLCVTACRHQGPGSNGACLKSGSTYTCSTGYYASDPGFQPNSTVVFSGGTYEFKNSLVIPSNVVMDFNVGTYIFDGSTAFTPPATGSVTINGNGVLFYVPVGSVDFGSGSSVTLTPTNNNHGVTIWAAGASPTINLANIDSNRNSFGGIYAPTGTVNITSTPYEGTVSAMFIVANTVSLGPHTNVIISGP